MRFSGLFAQQEMPGMPDFGAMAAMLIPFIVVGVLASLIVIVGVWKTFEKAGKPGWASLIPIYNGIVFLDIVGRPWWWLLVFCIPCIGWYFAIIVTIEFVQAFGQGTGMVLLMIFLPFIAWLILGFGSARYVGPPARPTA